MASHSSLNPDDVPARVDRNAGRALDSYPSGPSDSSDSGADLDIPVRLDVAEVDGVTLAVVESGDDSDREHTGERLSVEREADIQADADIGFDRIVRADEAGLGDGLDQAEEAQLGVTDEELLGEDPADD